MVYSKVFAQQDPQYSQYMFNTMAINPGYAGSGEAICASLLHRTQWMGFEGAPNTSLFQVNSPFKLFNLNHGAGVTIINDLYGFNNDLGLNLAYAYRININKTNGKLGIGISGGFRNQALKDVDWRDPEGGTGDSDGYIPKNEAAMSYDLNFGIYYKTDNLYLGVSSSHISQPQLKYENAQLNLQRHYYLTAGYSLLLNNPSYEIRPSVLLASDGAATEIDFSSLVIYNKKLWGGVSYRMGTAIIGMVGLELLNGIKLGYSYDFTFNDIRKNNQGSHEIMVSYCFTILKDKIPHKYKSVRFL